MARRRKTRKASKARKSTGCRCKIGDDGNRHCYKIVKGQIKGCKKR